MLMTLNLNLIKELSKYKLEFGLFEEDSIKKVKVKVLNTDDTITNIDMELGDVMYFTENGTMTIPGKHILDRCLNEFNQMISNFYEDLIYDILNETILDESSLVLRLTEFSLKLQALVQVRFMTFAEENNIVGTILQQKDGNKYIYSIKSLSKYIKCKVIKQV